jgi:hypothetical protein
MNSYIDSYKTQTPIARPYIPHTTKASQYVRLVQCKVDNALM